MASVLFFLSRSLGEKELIAGQGCSFSWLQVSAQHGSVAGSLCCLDPNNLPYNESKMCRRGNPAQRGIDADHPHVSDALCPREGTLLTFILP